MKTQKALLCNAGFNAASALPDGSVNLCYDRQTENIGNLFTGIHFRDKLVECTKVHCSCPLWAFNKELHKKAQGLPYIQKPYDVFLHWHITYECQMLCNYCIVTGPDRKTDTQDKLRKSPPVDIEAMLRTLSNTGYKFYVSLMGGEPFVVPNIIEVVEALQQQGHRIGANTNLAAIDPIFWRKVDISKLGHFHISLHIHPMQKMKLTDRFLENFKAMRDSGFTDYNITTVAHPKLFPEIDQHKEFFTKHGIQFQLIPMIEGGGATGGKKYPESYTKKELEIIESKWLDDYFPVVNAYDKAPAIESFRAGKPKVGNHEILVDQ